MRTFRPGRWRDRSRRARAGSVLVLLIALGSLVGLGLAARGLGHAWDDADKYQTAPVCSATTGANSDCIRHEAGSVVTKYVGRRGRNDQLVATVGGAQRTVDFAAGDDLLPKLSSGDKLTADMWHGTVAAVSAHGKRSESLDSPTSELRRDKAIPLAFLAVAMICVPLALISILSEPSRQIGGRPPALFATVFSPLAGVVLLALAGGLADGHVVAITLAVTLWTAVGVLSAMVARQSRSQTRQRRAEIDTAVLKAVSRRRR